MLLCGRLGERRGWKRMKGDLKYTHVCLCVPRIHYTQQRAAVSFTLLVCICQPLPLALSSIRSTQRLTTPSSSSATSREGQRCPESLANRTAAWRGKRAGLPASLPLLVTAPENTPHLLANVCHWKTVLPKTWVLPSEICLDISRAGGYITISVEEVDSLSQIKNM